MTEYCQCCGKKIEIGDEVVEVRKGIFSATVRYYKTKWEERNFFHKGCDIAV